MKAGRNGLFIGLIAAWISVSGCGIQSTIFGAFRAIRVEVLNDTGFTVDTDLRYSEDDTLFDALLADRLDVGRLLPGEAFQIDFDCDALGLIRLAEGSQEIPLLSDPDVDTPIFQRGDDYDCGDTIEFRFVGDGDDFDVIVTVNGLVVRG